MCNETGKCDLHTGKEQEIQNAFKGPPVLHLADKTSKKLLKVSKNSRKSKTIEEPKETRLKQLNTSLVVMTHKMENIGKEKLQEPYENSGGEGTKTKPKIAQGT